MPGQSRRGSRGGVGVWVDHAQAIFVRLASGAEEPEISSLRSDAPLGGRASPIASGETKEQAESRVASAAAASSSAISTRA